MRLLDISHDEPEMNLALDEALLNVAEASGSGETLRFWESPVPFVVLGLTQATEREVIMEACERDGVPIMRRCSAGGCVIQGPGCLNFSLILDQERTPELGGIHSSYRYILGAISASLSTASAHLEHVGTSDLAIGGQKVSGNAQRRKRRYILHHGSLLHGMDFAPLGKYLREPVDRPEYRGERTHESFVRNLDLDAEVVKSLVAEAFGASPGGEVSQDEQSEALRLGREKYETDAWNRRK